MLIDTGSQINAVSADWYNQNKDQLGPVEVLKMHNTVIRGAIGNKSKNITPSTVRNNNQWSSSRLCIRHCTGINKGLYYRYRVPLYSRVCVRFEQTPN